LNRQELEAKNSTIGKLSLSTIYVVLQIDIVVAHAHLDSVRLVADINFMNCFNVITNK